MRDASACRCDVSARARGEQRACSTTATTAPAPRCTRASSAALFGRGARSRGSGVGPVPGARADGAHGRHAPSSAARRAQGFRAELRFAASSEQAVRVSSPRAAAGGRGRAQRRRDAGRAAARRRLPRDAGRVRRARAPGLAARSRRSWRCSTSGCPTATASSWRAELRDAVPQSRDHVPDRARQSRKTASAASSWAPTTT